MRTAVSRECAGKRSGLQPRARPLVGGPGAVGRWSALWIIARRGASYPASWARASDLDANSRREWSWPVFEPPAEPGRGSGVIIERMAQNTQPERLNPVRRRHPRPIECPGPGTWRALGITRRRREPVETLRGALGGRQRRVRLPPSPLQGGASHDLGGLDVTAPPSPGGVRSRPSRRHGSSVDADRTHRHRRWGSPAPAVPTRMPAPLVAPCLEPPMLLSRLAVP